MAHTLAHPFTLVEVLRFSARLHPAAGSGRLAQAHAETLLTLATEHGFARFVAFGAFFRGWALAAQGPGVEGIAQIRQGLDASRATGTMVGIDVHALAEAYGQVGQVRRRIAPAAGASGDGRHHGEHWTAERHRVHGELLLRQTVPDAPQAETCFQQALDVARRQQAKSWELRAAMSLSRLWQRQGKRAAAHDAAGTDLRLVHRGL